MKTHVCNICLCYDTWSAFLAHDHSPRSELQLLPAQQVTIICAIKSGDEPSSSLGNKKARAANYGYCPRSELRLLHAQRITVIARAANYGYLCHQV